MLKADLLIDVLAHAVQETAARCAGTAWGCQ